MRGQIARDTDHRDQIQSGSMDPAHGSCWLCILVGCVFFLFSILDFPLIWYYLYNFIIKYDRFAPFILTQSTTDGFALNLHSDSEDEVEVKAHASPSAVGKEQQASAAQRHPTHEVEAGAW